MADYANVVRAEIGRVLADRLSHLPDSLSWIVYTGLLYYAVIVILGGITGGAYGEGARLAVLVGWLTFQVAGGCMMSLQEDVATEAETGTLEQVVLSAAPLSLIFIARSLAHVLVTGLLGFITGVVLLLAVVRAPSMAGGQALVVLFLISFPGAIGLGLVLAGVNLVVKRVSSVANVVFSLMIFLTGSLVGFEALPFIFGFTKFVFPLTWGISLMRESLSGADLAELARSRELAGLALHSLVYLALGIIVFSWGFRKARARGSLGHY